MTAASPTSATTTRVRSRSRSPVIDMHNQDSPASSSPSSSTSSLTATPAVSALPSPNASSRGGPRFGDATEISKGGSKKHHAHAHGPPGSRALAVLSWRRIAKRAIRSFVLAFGVKSGITLLLKLLKLRKGKESLLSILKATKIHNRDGQRIGALFGLFTLLFHSTVRGLDSVPALADLAPRWRAFIAGAVAGLSILVESPDNRLMFTQQFSMRALQAGYNGLKHRDLFHFPLGDSLLFVLSCAQIMFAYTQYPTTLPRDFYAFMIKMARIPQNVLAANRVVTREGAAGAIDVAGLTKWAAARKTTAPENLALISSSPANLNMLPCHFLHPESTSCTRYCGVLSKHIVTNIFPVYFTLHAVPTLLLRSKQVLRDPASFIRRVVFNTSRSTAFLVAFVAGFQALCCVQRKSFTAGLLSRDRRMWYFVFGLINSLSILIEDKKRRSELGLYVAPKAIHSLYQIMTDHKEWLPSVPHLDVAVFSAAMGTIMSFYAREPERLSPMILRVLPRFIR
ncbi:hypothetical protein H9P43_000726 [Blastocladiella emersonii ATCC 22665]|nr:hypothetical protein H9P43_000726 [Blastocladiella emersonii ATCC 22665]